MLPFAGYHAYLISRNRTTLESMEGAGRVRVSAAPPSSTQRRDNVSDRLRRLAGSNAPSSRIDDDRWKRDEQLTREEGIALRRANKLNIYDVGIRENWKAVMGNDWRTWFVPIGDPESDGYSFQINTDSLQQLEEVTACIRGGNRKTPSSANDSSSPLSSIRGKAREQPLPRSVSSQSKSTYRSSAHGVVEWGAPPKKDFVLYGLNDDDVDSGGVLERNTVQKDNAPTTPRHDVQMDADIWS
jgi:hypothetical protein